MPDREMLTVFAYDISSDKRRRKVARALEKVAARVQESVFEVRMSAALARRTAAQINPLLGPGDSLRLYALGAAGQSRSQVLGDGAPMETDVGYWLL
jgi:CRISPR-associated protein Cas2